MAGTLCFWSTIHEVPQKPFLLSRKNVLKIKQKQKQNTEEKFSVDLILWADVFSASSTTNDYFVDVFNWISPYKHSQYRTRVREVENIFDKNKRRDRTFLVSVWIIHQSFLLLRTNILLDPGKICENQILWTIYVFTNPFTPADTFISHVYITYYLWNQNTAPDNQNSTTIPILKFYHSNSQKVEPPCTILIIYKSKCQNVLIVINISTGNLRCKRPQST